MDQYEFDWRRLRGILAERRISQKQFAAACGLNPTFTNRILCGCPAGELARIKIERGLQRLELDKEVSARVLA